jgi:ribosomal protein S18 acetylase RimI-like enzyme
MKSKLLKVDTTRPDSDGVIIRFMCKMDRPDMVAIESKCFEHPYSEDDLQKMTAQRNCLSVVVEVDRKIVGFMLYELHSKSFRIVRIAILPEHRRCRLASKIVQRLQDKMEIERRGAISLEITETNLPGQLFFAANGFRATAVINDRWEGFSEAAYVMCYKPTPKEDGPMRPGNRLTPYFE